MERHDIIRFVNRFAEIAPHAANSTNVKKLNTKT